MTIRRNTQRLSLSKLGSLAESLVLQILLFGGSLIMLIPFVWMVSSALKQESQVFIYPPQWIPDPIVWDNLQVAWNSFPMGRYYLNSMFIASAIVVGQLLRGILAAYVFARLRFPGKNIIFMGFVATMMIPRQVTMIPSFLILRNLHWIDKYQGIIVPALSHPFGIFLLRQFFLSIPTDLEDAACIDGCSRLGVLFRIILPLSKGVVSTLTVFVFMSSWNAFLWPLIVLNTQEKFTIQIGLAMLRDEMGTNWAILMAATFLATLPVILLYLVAQKQIVRGITLTGLKY